MTDRIAGARILIVDDDNVMAAEIGRIVSEAGHVVVGMARSGTDAVEAAARLSPDLILMDVELDGQLDGIEAAGQIARTGGVAIVFLTGHGDVATVERAAEAAAGYVVKPFTGAQLLAAIRVAIARPAPANATAPGEAHAAGTLLEIVEALRRRGYSVESEPLWEQAAAASGLSRRELDIARRVINGQRVSTVSQSLGISESTVRNHLKSVFRKLAIHSQAELVAWASGLPRGPHGS